METQHSPDPSTISSHDLTVLQRIITEVQRHTDLDFSHYKSATLLRRVQRRVIFHHLPDLDTYLQLLDHDHTEGQVLAHDLFIPVTQFFRDSSVFEALARDILPQMIKRASPSSPLRLWIAGCSTGEEVYSFAMSLYEICQEHHQSMSNLQLIGTDANAQAIEHARRGSYTQAEMVGLSSERIQHFFRPSGENYEIIPEIRNCCIFALHHLYQDPPFGQMHLISCRNVFIYLQPPMQQHLFHLFHYALLPQGILVLGKMENLGANTEFFTPLSLHEKIYQKQDEVVLPALRFPILTRTGRGTGLTQQRGKAVFMDAVHDEAALQQIADQLLLARYAPASVLVTPTLEIVQVRGHTGSYLEPAPGKASLNLLKMVREELVLNLRRALRQAAKERQTVFAEESTLSVDGQPSQVKMEVIPLQHEQSSQPFYLVLFIHTFSSDNAASKNLAGTQAQVTQKGTKDRRITVLEHELQVMREEMRTLIEEQTAYREELQTANEELLSSNEELHSANEELETSRETLHTTNKTLQKLNINLSIQQQQVTLAQRYADAIITTVRDPLLVLDSDGRVQRVNAAFSRNFHVSAIDTEGQLLTELGNGQWNIPALQQLLGRVLMQNEAFEDFVVEHEFPAIGHQTMLLNARRIDASVDRQALILLIIEDITERQRLEHEQEEHIQAAEFGAAIGEALTRHTDFYACLHACAQAMVTHLGAAFARIWLLNEDEQVLELQASAGLYTHLDGEHGRIPVGAFKIGRIAQTRTPHLTNTVVGDPQVTHQDWAQQEGMVAFAGYPLLIGERVIGVIAMFARHRLNNTIIRTLAINAANVALGIERFQMQQALMASEERMRLWIEQASDVLTVLSATGTVLHQSASVQRVLGWSVEECLGANLLEGDWIHPQDHPLFRTFLLTLHKQPTEIATIIVRMQQKKGTWIPLELRGRNLLNHPHIHGLVILGSDVTERLTVEQQKEEFFGMVSHELRTPITAMKGNTQLVERRLKRLLTQTDALPESSQVVVQETIVIAQRIVRQINVQNRIIQDLVDMARIQSKKLDLQRETCSLEAIVHDTVEDLRASAPERVIEEEVLTDPPLLVQADAQRIGQVLTNYITNALKYSPATALISVGIKRDGNEVRVWVRDQGPGLSEQQQQLIWDRFYQVPGRPEGSGFGLGLGLGLHICAHIIKEHGGKLGVESQQGEGSTFWFCLPLADQPLPSTQKSDPADISKDTDA